MNNKKFRVVTLGCRTNQYESQAYANQLTNLQYSPASVEEKADICVVNTCTVTKEADKSSKAQIKKLLKNNPNAKVYVTGCLVDNGTEKLDFDERITLVSNKEKESLLLKAFPDVENLPEFSIENFTAHTRAFVKVQDGCNSFCTYCIIPYVRGRSRSRKMEEVIEEIQRLIQSSYKEVVLTGINIGDYEDKDCKLVDLIKEVDQMEGLERVRVSSIDPDEVDSKLADAIIEGEKTCPSMHIVLQSGSNTVLKRMNRKYTKQIFLDTVSFLVSRDKDFTITTDVIVGFPGESEEDFLQTVDIIEKLPVAHVHVFPYSERPRTRAAMYKDKIEPSVIHERKSRLIRIAEKKAFSLREEYIGRSMKVLIEGKEKDGFLSGHTTNFLLVKIPYNQAKPNQIVTVFLKENKEDALYGEVCE